MIINNNMNAMNAHRNMSFNTTQTGKAMEKLSSGLRINRAGDDAAGLAISEKMRGQIRGLDQASRNAQDGISLIQTAEGALNETHDILQRMRELAVQSSNDTNNENDRGEIQKEVDELAKEITRIAENTEFNTKNLMGPNGFSGKFHIGANAGQDIELSIGDMTSRSLGVVGSSATAATVGDLSITNRTENAITINYTPATTAEDAAAVTTTTAAFDADTNTITVTLAQGAGQGTGNGAGAIQASQNDIIAALNGTGVVTASYSGSGDASTALLTVPTNSTADQVTAATLDLTKGIDVSSQEAASAAITTIQSAIDTVSGERSKLGAVQNRLEHTINNLNVGAENLQAAESRIRDVDMAKEMMNFTKNNILNQAAQAMLAQSKSQPEAVLQLLR